MFVKNLNKVSDDGKIGIVSKGNNLFVNHKSEDSHLGGTAVVELNGTLGELFLLIKVIPSEVNVSVAEVTNELVSGSFDVTHDGALKDSDEGDDLDKSSSGDGVRSDQGGNTVGVRVEGVTRVVNVSGKVDSGTGDNLSKEGKLTDTSVLELDVTKTVETFLVSTVEESKRIPASKRRLSTKFFFEGLDGGGGLTNLSGSKGGSGGEEGGEDSKLHFDYDLLQTEN
mmetsp:Transcript_25788/g.33669  ORF Transcript_25788/g.33669 Transcript_25788/m.33669 type:complete len:226 (-) Transcript_25788:21-698(-)